MAASDLSRILRLGSRERLRAFTARLESLREEERIRVAREIHDELGQTLRGLKMDLLWVERKLGELMDLPAINSLLDRVVGATELVGSITTVQKIAADLRPGVLTSWAWARRCNTRPGVSRSAPEFCARCGRLKQKQLSRLNFRPHCSGYSRSD